MALDRLLKFIDEGASFKIKPATLKSLEALEGGADAVSQLKQSFDLTPLADGTFFAERKAAQAIEETRQEIGALQNTAATMENYGAKLINGEVPAGTAPVTHELNTSGVIGGITLPQQMLESWTKLHDTAGIINAKLMPTEFDLLPSTKAWDGAKIGNTASHVILNPKVAFKDLADDLVFKPTELKLMADKFGKHSRKIWKTLTKPLKNDDMDALNHVLREGDDLEEVFTPVPNGLRNQAGDVYEVSDGVKEAYFGSRMLMDHLYWLNNGAAVQQAQRRGFKLMSTVGDDGVASEKMVRTIKGRHGESLTVHGIREGDGKYIKWSKDFQDEGWEVVEMLGKDGDAFKVAVPPEDASRLLKDIHQGYDMIGYRKGYVPVVYKDQWAVHKLVKMNDGTFRTSRVATAPTRVRANKAVSRLADAHELGEGENTVQFIAARKNDASVDVAYGQDMHSILDNLSPREVENLQKALVEMGMDPEIAGSLEKTGRFFSHKRNPHMMQRGMRLSDWAGQEAAPILPADEAIQKYMQASSSYAANADYVGQLEQRFVSEFGDVLTNPNDYRSAIRWKSSAVARNGRTPLEASLVRGQINRISGQASDVDRVMENLIVSKLDQFAETYVGRNLDKLLDKLTDVWGIGKFIGTPSLAQGIAKLKGFTATAKLGLWNFSQAIVQGTAALNVLGKNPIQATRATKDVIQAIAPEIMKIGRTPSGRRLYQLLDDSGFIAGFDYVELQRTAAKGTDKLLGSRALRKLWDTNLWPYQLGEGGVRALAWFTERRVLIDDIRRGLINNVEIDGARFRQIVNERASITALNMSRINQPLMSRGIWGVPLQFKQFLVQQGEFLFNPKNFRSRREMTGVWAAWVGAFGIQGMPWLFDVTTMVEGGLSMTADGLESLGIDAASPKYIGSVRAAAQEMSDRFARLAADKTIQVTGVHYDDARAFWNRWAQSGLISAFTDGELNIANRASLARVFTEYYGNQTIDDTLFGPGYQTAKMLIDNNITNLKDLVSVWREGDGFSREYMLSAAVRSTRGLPGLQHPLQAAEVLLTGEWRDTERRLIAEELTLQQTLLLGTGFQPAKRGERFERTEFTKKQKDAWKEWMQKRTKRIARLSMEGHSNYAGFLLDDTLDQIQDVNPLLAREFMMIYSQEMLRRGLSEADREFMYRHQDAEIMDSSYDKFFFGRDTYTGWRD